MDSYVTTFPSKALSNSCKQSLWRQSVPPGFFNQAPQACDVFWSCQSWRHEHWGGGLGLKRVERHPVWELPGYRLHGIYELSCFLIFFSSVPWILSPGYQHGKRDPKKSERKQFSNLGQLHSYRLEVEVVWRWYTYTVYYFWMLYILWERLFWYCIF